MVEQATSATFRSVYAEQLGIRPEEFERRILWQCLPWWKRPFARFGQRFAKGLFVLDREFLKDIAEARTRSDVLVLLEAFRYRGKITPKFPSAGWG